MQKTPNRSLQWRKANPEKARLIGWRYELKKLYGITVEQYNEMLESQGGVCAICHDNNIRELKLAVDHDHETGKVRGLLCDRCNRGIGLLRTIKNVKSAYKYLKENQ